MKIGNDTVWELTIPDFRMKLAFFWMNDILCWVVIYFAPTFNKKRMISTWFPKCEVNETYYLKEDSQKILAHQYIPLENTYLLIMIWNMAMELNWWISEATTLISYHFYWKNLNSFMMEMIQKLQNKNNSSTHISKTSCNSASQSNFNEINRKQLFKWN
jgi:hypothetical protein